MAMPINFLSHRIEKPSPLTAEGRWCSFGPYYAMFPVEFALDIIQEYTNDGDLVFDPFCGRGTSLFSASMLNRKSIGIEISPLGWLYSNVKTNPAPKAQIIKRAKEIYNLSLTSQYKNSFQEYNEFFNLCYSKNVLNFLITARNELHWEKNHVDRTLMSFIVIFSHGEYGLTFSNQMQHVKACGPNYAIKWWKEKGMLPPDVNPLDLLLKKIEWRYAKGEPLLNTSKVYLDDSMKRTSKLYLKEKKVNLLFTSPPYYGVTDYHLDQWLRLWLLGGEPEQKFNPDPNKHNFGNKEHYEKLIYTVFNNSKKLLADNATLYIRTDARNFSKHITLDILTKLYSNSKRIQVVDRPFTKRTQTALHGDDRIKPGECDIILTSL